MRKGIFGSVIFTIAAPIAAGCAVNGSDASESASDELAQSTALADHVTVAADRLTFDRQIARSSTELGQVAQRIKTYQTAYDQTANGAPAAMARGSTEHDQWVIDQLLTQKIRPVYLVGQRQANARNADGSIRTDVKNPYGYLRRAVSTTDQDGQLVVVTKPASIIEASVELRQLGLLQGVTKDDNTGSGDDDDNSGGDGTDDNWHWAKQYPFSLVDIDLSRSLYHRDIGAGIGSVDVGLKDSHFRITGNLDAMAAGRWVRPREAHAILTLNVDGKVLLDGTFDGAFGASSGNVDLYRKSFDIAAVGGFPLSLDFAVQATCDLAANGQAEAQVGATLTGSISGGATYERDQGFDTVWTPQWPQFAPINPTLTSSARVEGKCQVTATAGIHLFDAVGPEASADAFLQVDANATTSQATGSGEAKVTAGIDAQLGGELKPFGIDLGSIETTPYHKEWVIFDQPIHFGSSKN
jgi:hypothetical protein